MDNQPQAPGGDLKQLAAEFGKLSDAENLLLEKVPSGDWAVCGPNDDAKDKANDPKDADKWEKERQIRAELLAWLCTNEQARKHVHTRGIQVYGADITGPLDLSFVNVPFQLMLLHCRLKEDINLRRAEVSQLDLRGSLVRGILADDLIVRDNVALGDGFTANGAVSLPGAQIGGDLDCDAGTFTNKGGNALNADQIKVGGVVFLSNGFTANGAVRLPAAQIGSNLECEAGTFTNEGRYALFADGINVRGSVHLRQGTNAEGKKTPFSAKGAVNLTGAQIDGQIDCSGGVFSNPGGDALSAYRSVVKGSVVLGDGFSAEGRVYLGGAQIGGDLYCVNGNFQKASLDLTDASAGSLIDSGLNDVSTSVANSDPTKWPQQDKLLVDGFVYGRISSEGRINVAKRIEWLGLQPRPPFRQQPYLHLAKVLKDSGDSDGALHVQEKMEELRRSTEQHGPFARSWSWLLRMSIGYGYDPARAIWLIILLSVLGSIVYSTSGTMVPTDKDAYVEFKDPKTERQVPPHYPSFSPLVYSLENSLPLVKLGQADKWQPDPGRKGSLPTSVRWFLRIQILLGWLLATLFVAGVSGIVHKE